MGQKYSTIGLIGLAVMGKNLAFNMADKGFSVSVYNRSFDKTKDALAEYTSESFRGFEKLEDFVLSLESPRKIMLMVKAGEAVDQTIALLLPLLSPGDLIIDGGNSHFKDTQRRTKALEEKGLLFLGTGVSGGEEGARFGPAIMVGGTGAAYSLVENIFSAISAKYIGQDGKSEDCCGYLGSDGAGHFVKMVHNGIEYADMQLIAEAYSLLKEDFSNEALSQIFAEWNEGELESYLIDITKDIFKKKDAETGAHLVDLILDRAGQKGTGKWTAQISLDLASPIQSITTAVYERFMSARKDERIRAASLYKGQAENGCESNFAASQKSDAEKKALVEEVRRALYASKICAYAQGFSMLLDASREENWNLDFAQIAKVFRGGCIIRARFLTELAKEFDAKADLENILLSPLFSATIKTYEKDWRSVVSKAILQGRSLPAFSSALSYFDSYTTKNLPTNLLQAMRDYFGAHTYERIDKEGFFHTNWGE